MVLFTGPNGCGKSTRLKAIQLALLGYIPDGAKTARDLMHFATNTKEMAVSFAIPFLRVDRVITGSTTSAGMKTFVSPDEGDYKDADATEKDKQARVFAELGGGPFALDLGAFTAMNENQQRSFILDLCASKEDGDPLHVIRERLAKEGVGPETRAMQKALGAVEGKPDNLSQALLQLTAILRSHKLELENAIKKAKGTAQDMAKDRTSHNTSGASIAETKEEIEKAQKALEEIAAERGRIESAGKINEGAAAQLRSLEAQILAKRTKIPAGATAESLTTYKQNAERAAKDLTAELQALDAKIADLEALIERTKADQALLDKEILTATQRIQNAKRRADLLQEGKCPLNLECKQPPEAFKEALQAALKSIGYFGKGQAQTEAALKEIGDKILGQVMELRAAEKRRRDLPGLIADSERHAAAAARQIEALKELDDLGKAKAELEAQQTEAVVTADEEALAAREAGARTRLAELKVLLEQKELQKAAEIAFTRALQERQEMEEDLAIVKAALDVVGPKGLQAEAAKVAAGPFLTAVNMVLRRFDLKAYVETERNGKAVFEWGLEHPSHGKRRWEVLPTSYKAIMGAAVALAFFSLRAAKKAILIVDDLEHLDSANRTRFFEAVAAAIKDQTLDLFVGAQTLPQKPGKILKVINLGPQQPAAGQEAKPDTQAA